MDNNQIYHWGIKGMKWGIRRYQNTDGSLTPAGKTRYAENDGSQKQDVTETLARLSGRNKSDIEDRDRDMYTSDVEVVQDNYYFSSTRFSSKNNTDVKHVAEELVYKHNAWLKDVGNGIYFDDMDFAFQKNFIDTYIKPNPEAYAKAVMENAEYWMAEIDKLDSKIVEHSALYHHGTKGMKWGRRLYQNKDGSLTPLGRIRYRDPQSRAQLKRQATLEAKKQVAKTEADEASELERKKEAVLKSRSAKELYNNAHLFTTPELKAAHDRLKLEQDIKKLAPEEVSKGKKFLDFVKSSGEAAKTVGDAVKNTSDAYNNVKKVLGLIDNNKKNNSQNSNNSKQTNKADKNAKKSDETSSDKTDKDTKNKAFNGKVSGEGASHETFSQKHNDTKQKAKKETVIDATPDMWKEVYEDTTSSGKSYVSNITSGNSTVSGLLGDGSNSSGGSETVSKGKSYTSNLFSKLKNNKTDNIDYSSEAFKASAKSDIDTEIGDITAEFVTTVAEGIATWKKNNEKYNN